MPHDRGLDFYWRYIVLPFCVFFRIPILFHWEICLKVRIRQAIRHNRSHDQGLRPQEVMVGWKLGGAIKKRTQKIPSIYHTHHIRRWISKLLPFKEIFSFSGHIIIIIVFISFAYDGKWRIGGGYTFFVFTPGPPIYPCHSPNWALFSIQTWATKHLWWPYSP